MMKHAYPADVLPEVYGPETQFTEDSQKQLLSTEQQLALMSLVKVDDPNTKQQIIVHNLHLVVNIAKRYSNHGVAIFDLVREGNRGLIHALESFDLEGGFRFAAYATQCVRHSIENAIMRQNSCQAFAAS